MFQSALAKASTVAAGAAGAMGAISSMERSSAREQSEVSCAVNRRVFLPDKAPENEEGFVITPKNEEELGEFSAFHQEIFASFRRVQPTSKEVNAAISSISENEEVLKSVLPESFTNLRNVKRDRVYGAVHGLLEVMEAKLNASEEQQLSDLSSESSSISYGLHPFDQPQSSSWESIKQQYPCVICQDLLAAPIILNCSHSFCGACVDSLLDACCVVEKDSDVEIEDSPILYACPSCKEEITHRTFERLLDSDIQRLVNSVPTCEEKSSWNERRMTYLRDSRAKERALKEEKARRQFGNSGETEAEVEEDDDDEWWFSNRVIVASITFVVLALIAVVRARK